MNLEKERLKLEVVKVGAAKAELEFSIMGHLNNIDKLKKQISQQEERLATLEKMIKDMED